MVINFNTKLLAFEKGKNIKFGSEDKDMRLGDACVEALLMHKQGEEPPKGTKLKWGILAEKIYEDLEEGFQKTEITSEEVVLLKERVEMFYTTNVVLRVHRLLEGESQSPRKLSVAKAPK